MNSTTKQLTETAIRNLMSTLSGEEIARLENDEAAMCAAVKAEIERLRSTNSLTSKIKDIWNIICR